MEIVTYSGVNLDLDKERLVEIEIPKIRNKAYGEILFLGDFHLGNRNFSVKQLKIYLNMLKRRSHLRAIGMGDYLESQEFAPYYLKEGKVELETLKAQRDALVKLLKPVSNKFLALLYGNHEERFQKRVYGAVDLLGEVLLPALGYPSVTDPENQKGPIYVGEPQRGLVMVIKVKDMSYPIYIHHSKTRASVNLDVQLKKTSRNWMIPLIAHGHTHKMDWRQRTFATVIKKNGTFFRAILRQYLLSTGAFIKYAGYAEAASYPFPDIGAPIVRFYSNRMALEYVDPRVHEEFQKYLKR